MPTQVRIVLDTGAFLPTQTGQTHIDVGYFSPQDQSDIIVYADRKLVNLPEIKLGTGNEIVKVDHIGPSRGVATQRALTFDYHLLRKHELYDTNVPLFKKDAFDCTLRFSSGTFVPEEVKPRTFKECYVQNGSYTGRSRTTKPIAGDIVVQYQLGDNDDLQITSDKGEVLSTTKIAPGATQIDIYIMNDVSTVPKYFNAAIDHQGPCWWTPNPNPPPLNG
jgi:hypothetical protein